jgi:hypothetical protein
VIQMMTCGLWQIEKEEKDDVISMISFQKEESNDIVGVISFQGKKAEMCRL